MEYAGWSRGGGKTAKKWDDPAWWAPSSITKAKKKKHYMERDLTLGHM